MGERNERTGVGRHRANAAYVAARANRDGAELLREAATLMRERANSATPGPWGNPDEPHIGDFGWYVADCPAGETEDSVQGRADATHIASWHPAVALAVADWLDLGADHAEGGGGCGSCVEQAIATARAYLAAPVSAGEPKENT